MSEMYPLKRISANYIRRTFFTPAKTVNEATVTEVTKTKQSIYNKWMSFWKALLRDYNDVIKDVAKQMKERPVKSGIWCSMIGFSAACSALNPDEIQYRENILARANELIFVDKSIRNPEADDYLQTIEWYYNHGLIRRINFGVFSIIIRNSKNDYCGLYKDACPYTQPTYSEILENNLIDIGFWNKFWILEKKMVDYDINPNEWNSM